MTILKFRAMHADTAGRLVVVVYGGNPEFTLQNAGELRLTVDEWNVLKDPFSWSRNTGSALKKCRPIPGEIPKKRRFRTPPDNWNRVRIRYSEFSGGG